MPERDSPLAFAQTFSRIAAIAIATMGAAVALGWVFDVSLLKRVLPGLVAMKINTAVGFLASGAAVYALHDERTPARTRFARAAAVLVLLMGAATLAEYITGTNVGIDELLHGDGVAAPGAPHPGRMAPASSLCFALTGLALLVSRPRPASGRWPRWLSAPPLFLAALALFGYAYGVSSLYALGAYSGMAIHTAAGFFLLSLAIIAAHPHDGVMAIITSDSVGGLSARRLLPATAVVIFLLGLVRLAGQRAGLYDTPFGVALLASTSIIFTGIVITWHASLLHAADVVRRGKEAEIVALNASLEVKVAERTRNLTEALSEVRQLGGLLPICAWCKKIRDDSDYWHSVEGYISAHTDATFTHGVCPECLASALHDDTGTHPAALVRVEPPATGRSGA